MHSGSMTVGTKKAWQWALQYRISKVCFSDQPQFCYPVLVILYNGNMVLETKHLSRELKKFRSIKL